MNPYSCTEADLYCYTYCLLHAFVRTNPIYITINLAVVDAEPYFLRSSLEYVYMHRYLCIHINACIFIYEPWTYSYYLDETPAYLAANEGSDYKAACTHNGMVFFVGRSN